MALGDRQGARNPATVRAFDRDRADAVTRPTKKGNADPSPTRVGRDDNNKRAGDGAPEGAPFQNPTSGLGSGSSGSGHLLPNSGHGFGFTSLEASVGGVENLLVLPAFFPGDREFSFTFDCSGEGVYLAAVG
jgi:hypothetical protein